MYLRHVLLCCADTSYDYAVPEMGTMPLLSPENTLPLPVVASAPSDKDSVFSKGSGSKGSKSEDSKGKKVRVSWTVICKLHTISYAFFFLHLMFIEISEA
jgi:hypothetical protein